MSIRWRKDGRLLCAAMTEPEDGDTYIDDRLHHQLNSISRCIMADVNHFDNALWHWVHGGYSLRALDEVKYVKEQEATGKERA